MVGDQKMHVARVTRQIDKNGVEQRGRGDDAVEGEHPSPWPVGLAVVKLRPHCLCQRPLPWRVREFHRRKFSEGQSTRARRRAGREGALDRSRKGSPFAAKSRDASGVPAKLAGRSRPLLTGPGCLSKSVFLVMTIRYPISQLRHRHKAFFMSYCAAPSARPERQAPSGGRSRPIHRLRPRPQGAPEGLS